MCYRLNHSIRIFTLEECSSTQKILLDWWESHNKPLNYIPVLYSHTQTGGIGQKNRPWLSNRGSLTFSFVITTQEILSWTPLEIALICRNFFSENFKIDLKLKWPNDIVDSKNIKYGGIICHSRNQHVVVGIGLNLFPVEDQKLQDMQVGYLFKHEKNQTFQILSELIEYIVTHRYTNPKSIEQDWLEHCNHLNKSITVIDAHKKIIGIFKGLGHFGEALVQNDESQTLSITNGSFTVN